MLGMGSRSCRVVGAAALPDAEGPGISSMESALRGTLTAVAGFLPRFPTAQTDVGEVGPTDTDAEDGPTLPERPEKLRFFVVGVCGPAAAELFWRLYMLVGQVAISPDSSAAEGRVADAAEVVGEVEGGGAEAVECRPSDEESLGWDMRIDLVLKDTVKSKVLYLENLTGNGLGLLDHC